MTTERKVSTKFGHTMTVDPQDHIGKAIIRHGIYDRAGIDFILRLLKAINARQVLDVGGNIGNHALAFSTVAQRVLSFEPNPAAYSLLQRNARDNASDRLSVFNFGLSDADLEAELYVDESGNLGASTLRKESRLPSHSYRKQNVILKRGDAWVEANVTGPIDFIKIDVEGHEESVARGLQATINRHRPFLIMEWSDRSSDKRGMIDSGIFDAVFADYLVYATFVNIDRRYWRGRPFGALRRILTKFTVGKKLRYAPYPLHADDPVFKARDLLLVPREKRALLDGLEA